MSSSASLSTPAMPAPLVAGSGLPDVAVQRLIDQVAGFNLYAIPDSRRQSSGGAIIGVQGSEALHRFDIELQPPSLKMGVQAKNVVGERSGQLDLRWSVIPDAFFALPGREPPPTPLDRSRSQRFAMQEMTFRLGSGEDGFRSFGTGRTFPMMVGQQPRLAVCATGNVLEGSGKFREHDGNFTLCGDLDAKGFRGHIAVRIIDFQQNLRAQHEIPPISPISDPDPQTTYLTWAAQKGKDPGEDNHPSFDPSGQLRGLNIGTSLKRLHMDFAAPNGFHGTEFQIGDVIGTEKGFGRGSVEGASPAGTLLNPFLFEGVAQYSFFDGGRRVGAVTTNVLEGRRFDMKLQGAPQEPALRFGFFGPIVSGYGCFRDVRGLFYGVTGSVFNPPPGRQIITHFYMARVNDPEGKFRVTAGTGGWF